MEVHEGRVLQRRAMVVEGVAAVQCGLDNRVGESMMRSTIILLVGVRGCGPPFYVWMVQGGR